MSVKLAFPPTRRRFIDLLRLGTDSRIICTNLFSNHQAAIAQNLFNCQTNSPLFPKCIPTAPIRVERPFHSRTVIKNWCCRSSANTSTMQFLTAINWHATLCTTHLKSGLLSTRKSRNDNRNGPGFYASLLLAFAFPWTKKSDEDEKVDPVVMKLKRGVLATQKQNFEEAQELFHQALELGNQQHNEQIIDDSQHLIMKVNIFGLMADAAMKAADYKNAEKLYKEMMKLCLASGKQSDDPAIVELSIKLSSMYAMQSRDDEAEIGFKFCLEATRKAIEKSGGVLEADTNLLALHGLTCQSYARFLVKTKQYSRAIELYTSSLDVAKEVYGSDHPQTLVILNDIASAHIISGKYSEGVQYYKEAVERASRMADMEDSMIAFHYNLAEALILMKEFDEARRHCEQSLQFAKKVANPLLLQMAKQCLTDVAEVRKKQKQ